MAPGARTRDELVVLTDIVGVAIDGADIRIAREESTTARKRARRVGVIRIQPCDDLLPLARPHFCLRRRFGPCPSSTMAVSRPAYFFNTSPVSSFEQASRMRYLGVRVVLRQDASIVMPMYGTLLYDGDDGDLGNGWDIGPHNVAEPVVLL